LLQTAVFVLSKFIIGPHIKLIFDGGANDITSAENDNSKMKDFMSYGLVLK
jgi:hypothetical protein